MGIFGQGKMGAGAAAAAPAGAAPARAGLNLGNLFGDRGSQDNTDMIMALMAGASRQAQDSQNPILSLLAPIATSYIGSRAQKARDDARSAEISRMTETVLGPGAVANPRMQGYLDILGNEDAPDYLQTIAAQMIKGAVPYGGATGGKRSSGGKSSPGGKARPRLTYISTDKDGITRGYNAATGQREVVPNADAPVAAAPSLPPEPVMPKEPVAPDYDPLGIR